MQYRIMLQLQKCLYFHVYLYITWSVVSGYFLYRKIDYLGHLTKYLSLTVFTLLLLIETVRLYLGQYGNLSPWVPELAGFLMLTVLMQMPLVSFFLFHPFLLNTPTEFILHASLFLITICEVILGFIALKQASAIAKSVYLLQPKSRSGTELR